MSKFNQAITWLKEGKKVRRRFFAEKRYLFLTTGSVIEIDSMGNYPFKIQDLEADDWEIYEDKKETETKTLKDLQRHEKWPGKEFVHEDTLKQEAIKEIKLMREGFALPLVNYDIESYIKWKNNIKEEDLK